MVKFIPIPEAPSVTVCNSVSAEIGGYGVWESGKLLGAVWYYKNRYKAGFLWGFSGQGTTATGFATKNEAAMALVRERDQSVNKKTC